MTWKSLDKLLKVKIASLLHDPPWKVWVFAPRPRGPLLSRGKEIQKEMNVKAHEADAIALAEMIGFGSTVKDRDVRRATHIADKVAATFDRLLLPGEELVAEKVTMLNIFDPRKEFRLSAPNTACIENFVNGLRNAVEPLLSKDLLLAYHALWFAYEPLWYRYCMPASTSPSDTRTPTHSVFDHNYATAMISNITVPSKSLEPRFSGYVVVIDFAGVQRYISQSRKLRDLWASSWISSLLTWIAIEPFIACLGPDVVVSPSLRGNWFYIAWLVKRVGKVDGEVTKKLKDIAKTSYAYPEWPKYPLMPTRVLLVLPRIEEIPSNCRDECIELHQVLRGGVKALEDFVRKHVEERWRKALNGVIEILKALIEASAQVNELDESVLEKVAEEVALRPPLPLRVIVLELEEIVGEYERWLKEKGFEIRSDGDERTLVVGSGKTWIPWWSLLYHYVMSVKVPSMEALYKLSRIEPYAVDAWRAIGEEIRKLKFCTVCGERPAIIALPRGKAKQFYDAIPEPLRRKVPLGIIGEGERLCPICAVKRIVSFLYEEVLQNLDLGTVSRKQRLWMLSTFDIANVNRIAKEWSDRILDILEEISKTTKEKEKIFALIREELCIRYFDAGEYYQLSEVLEKVDSRCIEIYPQNLDLCHEAFNSLLGTVIEAAINLDVLEELRRRLDNYVKSGKLRVEITEKILKIVKEVRRSHSTRYAIVRGDGDRIGSGLHRGKLRFDARSYLETIAGKVWGRKDEKFDRWIDYYAKVCNKLGVTTPLTPSYHYSISRALSIAAIRDAMIVERHRGFVVYVGGDDILAVSPVKVGRNIAMLSIAMDTRRNYWGMYRGAINGFFTLVNPFESRLDHAGPVLAPALCCYGRSYGVVVAHYRDPMMIAIHRSAELEELAKERVATVEIGSKTFNKIINCRGVDVVKEICEEPGALCRDRLAFEEMRSRAVTTLPLAPLRNENVAKVLEKSVGIASMIGEDVSKSLLYDVKAQFGRELVELARIGRSEHLVTMLRHVISRNASRNAAERMLKILEPFAIYVDVYEDREVAQRVSGTEASSLQYGASPYEERSSCSTKLSMVPLTLEMLSATMIVVKASSR